MGTARESIPLDREEHKYAIFIVHYHKTGYVLTRELKNLVRELESEAAYPDLEGKRYSGIKHIQSGLDDDTGKRFAFDQYGNWPRSAFQTRNHMKETNLPNRFDMSPASLYVQESPDIFADDAGAAPLPRERALPLLRRADPPAHGARRRGHGTDPVGLLLVGRV